MQIKPIYRISLLHNHLSDALLCNSSHDDVVVMRETCEQRGQYIFFACDQYFHHAPYHKIPKDTVQHLVCFLITLIINVGHQYFALASVSIMSTSTFLPMYLFLTYLI